METQRKFDLINFFYGIGAAIILIAALFKFMGWKFADYLFMIGLIGEAFIFLISAFEWKSYRHEYKWDRIFPQLREKDEADELEELESVENIESVASVTREQQLEKILNSIVSLDNNLQHLNEATGRLNKTVEMLEKNYETMSQSTLEYQQQINSLKIKIASANDRLKEFENYKF